MWTVWLAAAGLAQVATCEKVGLAQIADVPSPAVIVVGERRGVWPDLLRAQRLVGRLARTGPVTVALEAVAVDKQPVLDQFTSGSIPLTDVPELTEWNAYWGIPFSGYQGLVSTGQTGVKLVAMGVEPELRPDDVPVPMPPGYLHIILDAVGEHAIPVELEPDFVQTMAYRDYRMAKAAIDGWDGEGVLVIVADRLHVEGGMGIQFQAQLMTEAPVSSVLLANAASPCYPNDRIWKDHPFDK